jgi:hypothetical protein
MKTMPTITAIVELGVCKYQYNKRGTIKSAAIARHRIPAQVNATHLKIKQHRRISTSQTVQNADKGDMV